MKKNRDDFSKSTKEIMAKRVGYLCSNPKCRKLTIGSNEEDMKSTSIGIAAHITAASEGGPRYEPGLTADQRCHISNGIWLCSSCAKLIDTDINNYSVQLLNTWKKQAEDETRKKLNGEFLNNQTGLPFLEADLVWHFGGRWNRGYSRKNPKKFVNGREIIVIGDKPIIHWALEWDFSFVIYNNSNYPAFNVSIESIGKEQFTYIDKLPKINNLPPLQNIDLKAKYEDFIEAEHSIADEIVKKKIPTKFNNLKLIIKYQDENRNDLSTKVKFFDGEIINVKI